MRAAGAATQSILRRFQEARQQRSLLTRLREYQGFVSISYETDDFLVTTAKDGAGLREALELRHEIFVQEWQGRRAHHGLDVDDYDFQADHLIIFDKRARQVVGTYRLLCSHFTHQFYSAGEFKLDAFLRTPTVKLEMGRACVRESHRDGATIDLLWKGLSRYIFKTKSEFLFGCASIKSVDPKLLGRVYRTLRDQGDWCDTHEVRAQWDYQFPGFSILESEVLTNEERREMVPPLLRSYLLAGAKVHGWPALDRDFACVDLLTILDWKQLKPKFQSRYVGSCVLF